MADNAAVISDDYLSPELQAAVAVAKAQPQRSWTDDLPEHGPLVTASGDPDYVPEPVKTVSDEEFERALEQLQEAGNLVLRLLLRRRE